MQYRCRQWTFGKIVINVYKNLQQKLSVLTRTHHQTHIGSLHIGSRKEARPLLFDRKILCSCTILEQHHYNCYLWPLLASCCSNVWALNSFIACFTDVAQHSFTYQDSTGFITLICVLFVCLSFSHRSRKQHLSHVNYRHSTHFTDICTIWNKAVYRLLSLNVSHLLNYFCVFMFRFASMIIWESCLASWRRTISPWWCMNRSSVSHKHTIIVQKQHAPQSPTHTQKQFGGFSPFIYDLGQIIISIEKSWDFFWSEFYIVHFFLNYLVAVFFHCFFLQTWQTVPPAWSRWCLGWWRPSTCSTLSPVGNGGSDPCQNPPMSSTKTVRNVAKKERNYSPQLF